MLDFFVIYKKDLCGVFLLFIELVEVKVLVDFIEKKVFYVLKFEVVMFYVEECGWWFVVKIELDI